MLKELINERWKEAFKARNMDRRTAYEMLKQRIIIAEKSGKYELPLSDEIVTSLIVKEYKEKEEVLQFYKPEAEAYKEAVAQMEILEEYLPKQLTEDEVIAIIRRIKESEPNLGKVIGLTVKEVGNRFDKSRIAALVRRVEYD